MSVDGSLVASVYFAYFAARDDAYSVPLPENAGWEAIRAPLTPEIILAGLTRQGPPISGYMLRPDNTTHVFAVDFDTDNGMAQAMAVADAMANDGVPAYIEASRRGAHLWCVVLDRMPGKVIRRALRGWIDEAGFGRCPGVGQLAGEHPKTGKPVCPICFSPSSRLRPGGRVPIHVNPKIELRPAQDEIYPDDQDRPGLGTCLRLPLMPHPKTGKRYPMVGVGGEKLGDSISAILLEIDFARAANIETVAARWVPAIKPEDVPRAYRRQREELPDDLSASQILREHYGIHNAAPGKAVRCSRHDDREASLSILRDDQRVICRGGGCELGGTDGRGLGTIQLLKLAGVEPGR
jgi:hypothetical protein